MNWFKNLAQKKLLNKFTNNIFERNKKFSWSSSIEILTQSDAETFPRTHFYFLSLTQTYAQENLQNEENTENLRNPGKPRKATNYRKTSKYRKVLEMHHDNESTVNYWDHRKNPKHTFNWKMTPFLAIWRW